MEFVSEPIINRSIHIFEYFGRTLGISEDSIGIAQKASLSESLSGNY